MKTIFFDFGNVVAFFDHRRAVEKLVPHTQAKPEELLTRLYNADIERNYEAGKISTEEYVRQALSVGELTCSHTLFLAAFVEIFEANREICDLIPQLKPRYRLLLASNTNEAHFEKFTQQFAVTLKHFDQLCPSHHLGARKPSADYFRLCQTFAEAEPDECLFIDDLSENIDGAKKHGWKTIHYQPGCFLLDQLRLHGVEI